MKRILALIICIIFLAPFENNAYAIPSFDLQYKLISDNYDLWDISDYEMSGAYYAITDLDGNGRLEVISAMNYSSGGNTHLEIFEVSEDGTGLKALGNGIDTNDFPLNPNDKASSQDGFGMTSGQTDARTLDYLSPDILIRDEMEIPFYITSKGTYEYIFSNYYSCGHDYAETVVESLCISNERLSVKPLVMYRFDMFADEREVYFNRNKIKTTKTEFDNWKSLYEGCKGGTAVFERFYDVSVSNIRKSYEIFAESVSRNTITDNSDIGVRTVIFGEYEQDNNKNNGKEAIEWIVLDESSDAMLVISIYGLDSKIYNSERVETSWESSEIRKWLNGEFYLEAFDADERESILRGVISNPANPLYGSADGKETEDMIFLLSVVEASYYFSSDKDRSCQPTKYALANGVYTPPDSSHCWFWLRTQGYNPWDTVIVQEKGNINYKGDGVYRSYNAIRPAMWISKN